jgi:hypothetical protein
MGEKQTHTYFIKMNPADDIIKIGKTISPETRINNFKTSNPHLDVIYIVPFDVESLLHKKFSQAKVINEFYEIKPILGIITYLKSCKFSKKSTLEKLINKYSLNNIEPTCEEITIHALVKYILKSKINPDDIVLESTPRSCKIKWMGLILCKCAIKSKVNKKLTINDHIIHLQKNVNQIYTNYNLKQFRSELIKQYKKVHKSLYNR